MLRNDSEPMKGSEAALVILNGLRLLRVGYIPMRLGTISLKWTK